MLRRLPLAALACIALAACAPGLPKNVDGDALDEALGRNVGDEFTCVIVVNKTTGKEVWRSGLKQVCRRTYPACTAPGDINVHDLARSAAKGAKVSTGCQSVSWAAGQAGRGDYAYAAVMYGKRALPGMEITRRLDAVFSEAGF